MVSVTAPANAVIGSPWPSGLPNESSLAIRNLSRITTEKSRSANFPRMLTCCASGCGGPIRPRPVAVGEVAVLDDAVQRHVFQDFEFLTWSVRVWLGDLFY